MFHVLKQPRRLVHFLNFLLLKNERLTNIIRPYSYFVNYYSQIALRGSGQNKGFLVSNDQSLLIISRDKHVKKKNRGKSRDEESSDEEDTDEEEEEDDDDDDELAEKDSAVKSFNVKSLRLDSVLKTVLRVNRKNIEKNFYENRIRVNGKKILKKSQNVKVNDVIDIIKGVGSGFNKLAVGQVKISKIQADPDREKILIKAWTSKSLEVENYEGANAWREQQGDGDSV